MKYIIVLFLILLNTSNLKKLRFLSESEFSMNILQYIDYAKNEGNYISKFKELFKKSDKKIQKIIKNIRIYQLDNIGYNGLYDFMIEDYDNIINEILEQAYFTGLYQTNYINQFIFKSKKILSSNWSKVSLIFQKNRIKKLNFISFFQRYKDSELDIIYIYFNDINISFLNEKIPIIMSSFSNNPYNPFISSEIETPYFILDRKLQSERNKKLIVDFFDLNIMKLFNDKFRSSDNFDYPDLN